MRLPFSKQAHPWEPIGLELRQLLQLSIGEKLDPWELAPHVGLRVVDGRVALAVASDADRRHLTGDGRHSWSGGVHPQALPDGTHICILNPMHSQRRNKITLMEEIVHKHRGHQPTALLFREDGFAVRDYNAAQEKEAYGIGAAALLPWETFFRSVNASHTFEELAEEFEVTRDLAEYRVKITGAYTLYRARQRTRA